MARTVEEINNAIKMQLVFSFAQVGIAINPNTWSTRNIMRLFCYIFAVSAAFIEQLMDEMKAEIEKTASTAAGASPLWIQQKMFEFQYSATEPQYLSIINGVPVYSIVDTSLRIIKACSVTSNTPNEVIVKVAKSDPFEPLTTNELNSIKSYINQIAVAGINYFVISNPADLVYVQARVYYNGQYTNMQATVIAAINVFLRNLSITNFNGALKVSDLEVTIRNIEGVNDVVLDYVKARNYDLDFASGIWLVNDGDVVARQWLPVAGYVIEETTTDQGFANTISMIAE